MKRRKRRGLSEIEAPSSLTRPACRKAWEKAEAVRVKCAGSLRAGDDVHAGSAWIAGPCVSGARAAQRAAEGGRCDAAFMLAIRAGKAIAQLTAKGAEAVASQARRVGETK